MEQILLSIVHLGFILGIGFYFITAMQWYSYRVERVSKLCLSSGIVGTNRRLPTCEANIVADMSYDSSIF